jgi:hypothetical protein
VSNPFEKPEVAVGVGSRGAEMILYVGYKRR